MACAAFLQAQGGLEAPRIGFFADAQGRLRPLLGVSGSFLAGEAVAEEVEWAACSGRFAVVKTRAEILVMDQRGTALARAAAAPGPALASFAPDGAPGLIHLPVERRWLAWEECGLAELAWDWPGEVVGLGWRRAAIRRDGALWLLRFACPGGTILGQEALRDVPAPVLLEPDGGLVYARGASLVFRHPAGHEREVPLPGETLSIGRLGDSWVLVRAGGRRLALRVDRPERQYELPEGQP